MNNHLNKEQLELERLVNDNYGLLVSQALYFNPKQQDIDDYIQIAAIGLIKAIKGFDSTKNTQFSTYAVTCIRNEISNYLRAENKYQAKNTELQQFAKYESEELIDYIPSTLTHIERETIKLRVMNYSYDEISSILDITRNQVRTSLYNAYRKIRKSFKKKKNTSL